MESQPDTGPEAAPNSDRPRSGQTPALPTFPLSEADARLFTGDLSDYGDSAERAMTAMLALDRRVRDWSEERKPRCARCEREVGSIERDLRYGHCIDCLAEPGVLEKASSVVLMMEEGK